MMSKGPAARWELGIAESGVMPPWVKSEFPLPVGIRSLLTAI